MAKQFVNIWPYTTLKIWQIMYIFASQVIYLFLYILQVMLFTYTFFLFQFITNIFLENIHPDFGVLSVNMIEISLQFSFLSYCTQFECFFSKHKNEYILQTCVFIYRLKCIVAVFLRNCLGCF